VDGHARSIAAAAARIGGPATRSWIPGPGSTNETLRKQLHARGLSVRDLELFVHPHSSRSRRGERSAGAEIRGLWFTCTGDGAPQWSSFEAVASALSSGPTICTNFLVRRFPVPAENLRILEGAKTLTLGSGKLEVVYTPGHASHQSATWITARVFRFRGRHHRCAYRGPCLRDAPTFRHRTLIWRFGRILSPRSWNANRAPLLRNFGFSENPAEHVCCFATAAQMGPRWPRKDQSALDESAAMASFHVRCRAEFAEYFPQRKWNTTFQCGAQSVHFWGWRVSAQARRCGLLTGAFISIPCS